MRSRAIRSVKRIAGSITVEASISMVAFTLALVSILWVINICRLRTHIGNALNRTALELSQYSYFYYTSGMYSGAASLKDAISGEDASHKEAPGAGDLMRYAALLLGMSDDDEASQYSASEPLRMLGAAVLGEGVVAVGSELIAAPITKAMFEDRLSSPEREADSFLRSMGVPDGIDGLDFGLSSFFPPEAPRDICLSVLYRVEVPFFAGLSVTIMQSAQTGAWLGGDETAPVPRGEVSPGEGLGNLSGTSIWKRPAFERGLVFRKELSASYPASTVAGEMRSVIGHDPATDTYYSCVSINTFSESYNYGGFNEAAACEHALRKVKTTADEVSQRAGTGNAPVIEYTVIVPEDVPDDVEAAVKGYLERKAAMLASEYAPVDLKIKIVKAGGNANE